jgi:hypothetical protein
MRLGRKSSREPAEGSQGGLRFGQPPARDLRSLLESSRTLEDRFNLFSGAAPGMEIHFYGAPLAAGPVDGNELCRPTRRIACLRHEELRPLRRVVCGAGARQIPPDCLGTSINSIDCLLERAPQRFPPSAYLLAGELENDPRSACFERLSP